MRYKWQCGNSQNHQTRCTTHWAEWPRTSYPECLSWSSWGGGYCTQMWSKEANGEITDPVKHEKVQTSWADLCRSFIFKFFTNANVCLLFLSDQPLIDRSTCLYVCVCVCDVGISHGGLPLGHLADCGFPRPLPPACNEAGWAPWLSPWLKHLTAQLQLPCSCCSSTWRRCCSSYQDYFPQIKEIWALNFVSRKQQPRLLKRPC